MDNPRVKRTTFVTLSALALAPWALPAAPADEQPTLRARVMAYVAKRQVELLREYVELLAIPNVASDGPGIRRNADHIVRMLEARGVKARLLDGEGGPPLVYGELNVGAPKTVVFYVHYDGQPVEPERWTSPPWTPVLRDGPLRPGAKTIDLCNGADPVCSDGDDRPAHSQYVQTGMTQQAADFVAAKLAAHHPAGVVINASGTAG